jgi:hypothetical protein
MVFRKILSTKLKINDKKLLRDYYNVHNGVNLTSISKISRRMGLTSDEAYETLREYYNEDIDAKQKQNRKEKRNERKVKTVASKVITKFLKMNKYGLKPDEHAFKNYFKYTIPETINNNFIRNQMLPYKKIVDLIPALPIKIFIQLIMSAI